MNLNQLKLFYMAVKLGHLGKAADELCISQPAVSKGIKRLQEHYEFKLVEKKGKTLVPTEAGEELFVYAGRIFELEKQAEQLLLRYKASDTKTITIHTSETFGAYFMPPAIHRFKKTYPGIRVSVDITHNRKVFENTLNLDNDFAIVSNLPDNPKITTLASIEDSMVIIMPPDHPYAQKKMLVPSDLEGQSLIMHEYGSAPRIALEKFLEEHHVSVEVPVELFNNEAIKQAVKDRMGLALVSEKAATRELMTGVLAAVPVSGNAISREFRIIRHRDMFLSREIEYMIELLLEL